LTQEQFAANETLKLACERCIEIIGEAIKNLSEDLKSKYPEVEWRKIARMRDRLIHHYFDVDMDILWEATSQNAAILKRQIEYILQQEENES
jgi:uncharacterized protein with HEPN domain